jgi:hypothetical protein
MKITRVIPDETCVCIVCKNDDVIRGNFIFLNLFPNFSITAELCDGHLKDLKEYIKKTIPRNVRFKTKDGFVSFKVRD